jgi:putative tryptophan/tyrosine transport system substrate-binding protein
MRRREFLTLLTGAAVGWPVAAQGQSIRKVWRLGWLSEATYSRGSARAAFFAALQDLGYTEGQNLTVEYRFANLRFERLPELATELVGLKLDAIVAQSTQALLALQQATSTIPIVMVLPGDPVGAGLVKSLAYPGANITGTSLMFPDMGGKRLQLLKEIVPTMGRVAIFGNSKNASTAVDMRAAEAAARLMGLQVYMVSVDSLDRLENGLDEMVNAKPDGVIVVQDALIFVHRERIAKVALQNRLASIFPGRDYVESGGLAGFGPNLDSISRRAAVYVDKIFKGAKPADLPVEQPTHFQLFINMKTAKALGITIPPVVLARADELIE